ncbi:MAG: hypothetical protein ACRDPL_07920 [Propionibacteriaceae bacterium]
MPRPYAELVYVLAVQVLRWGELAGLQVGDPISLPTRCLTKAKVGMTRLLPALHRSTMGTTTGTSGTVRARLFFNVSTYNSPPPLLARTARDNRSPGPGTITRSRALVVERMEDAS